VPRSDISVYMTFDTLTYAGTEKAFKDWNLALDSVQDHLTNQGHDVFTATSASASIAAEADSPTFTFEGTVVVQINRASPTGAPNSFSGGSIAFTGKRVENPAAATGYRQGVTYKFHGPWYDLSNTHYLQTFMGQGGVTYLAAETILNTSAAVTAGQIQISLGDQIQAILQWCIDSYRTQGLALPFQYIGRTLDMSVIPTGAINLNVGPAPGTPGGNYSFSGLEYNCLLSTSTTIDAGLYQIFLPSYITKPLMCADALRKCLELSPRVTVWFDYTQSPPMIHFTAIDSATPQTLALFDGTSHKSLNIQARNDLLVNSVRILYRIKNTSGGSPVINFSVDKWGPHGSNSASDPDYGLRVVNELVDLQGYARTECVGHLDCEPLACVGGTQAIKRAWWSSPRGGGQRRLIDSRVRFAATIPDATLVYATTGGTDSGGNARVAGQPLTTADGALFTNKLVRGTHHNWMMLGGGVAVVSLKAVVRSAMTYFEYDQVAAGDTPFQLPANETASNAATNGTPLRAVNSAEHHTEIELTNGITGTYYTVASTVAGESWITGYGGTAWYLYNQMNVLQFDGDFAKVEAAFGAGVSLGAPVHFTGGATLWTAMKAQVQEVRRDYGRHETSVRIGVAKHLNAGQLSALLNMWRFRRPWYNPAVRSDNTAGGTSGFVDQPITAGNDNSTDGQAIPAMTAEITYNTPGVPSSGIASMIVKDPQHAANNSGLNR